MRIQEKIDQLQSQVDSHSRIVEAHSDSVKRLQSELDALKAEAVKKEEVFRLWVPKEKDYWYIPAPHVGSFKDEYHGWGYNAPTRGLAFQNEQDAVEVGQYLAVIGKLCNAAKQLNKGKVSVEGQVFFSVYNEEGTLGAGQFRLYQRDRPRFHSREAAETALALLTEQERAVLVRGIS